MAQVFARDTRLPPNAPLLFLPPGQADQFRPDARAGHLICPLHGCPAPALTTRGGSRRAHFAHLATPNGSHGLETLAHHTAKHLLARWLREGHPAAEVFPDTKETEDGARPDVLLHLPDGRRVAYEVQYAPLTPQVWWRRHRRYADAGIRDVWLLGDRFQRRPRGAITADEVIIGPLAAQIADSGHPVLFIDAAAEAVGLATGYSIDRLLSEQARDPLAVVADIAGPFPDRDLDDHDFLADRPPSLRLFLDDARVHWHRLSDLAAAGGVLVVPGMREQLQQARDKRASAERDPARSRERAEAEMEAAAIVTAARAWRPIRRQLEQLHGSLPHVIDERAGSPAAIRVAPTSPQQWRWQMLQDLDERVGQIVPARVLASAAVRDLKGHYLPDGIHEFLVLLRAGGWIWFAGPTAPDPTEGVLILAGSVPSPEPLPRDYTRQIRIRGRQYDLVDEVGRVLWTADSMGGQSPLVRVSYPTRRHGKLGYRPKSTGTFPGARSAT